MLEKENQQIQHWLEIEDNQGQRTVILEATTCTVGRDSTNTIVLHSMLVSRQHAILLRMTTPDTDSHFFRLIDGNLQGKRSTNGIEVNSQTCFSADLKHGDMIVFGGEVSARYCNNASLPNIDWLKYGEADDTTGILTSRNSIISERIAFPSQLETSTESSLVRLASFPELLSNPILEIDLSGAITYLNPAALAQFPDIREAKLSHPILAGIVSTVRSGKEKFFVREVEVGELVFEQSVHYIAESDLIRSYVVDVTKRKQTEIALRESEAKNRALLNAIPDLILRINQDGTYLDYIPAKDSEMSSTSQMLGKNEYDAMPPEVAEQRMHYVKLALSTGKPQIFEYKLPNNHEIWQEEARIVVSGKDEVLAIVRDITQRKQVEALLQQAHDELEIRVAQRTAQLSQANEQLRTEIAERQRAEEALRSSVATNRALLNAIPDSMFHITKDGTIGNYKAAKDNSLPLLPDGDLVGKKVERVFPIEVAQPLMQGVEQALATGDIQVLEYQMLVNDSLLDYEARIAISAEDRVMTIIRDITERKQAEADIRYALEKEKELHELKSRFVSMTSHEFRTPLTTILSSAELLQDYGSSWDEEKKLKHLTRIQTAVKHMTGLLNDVLLIGKADAGKLEFKPTSLDLVQFCRDLVEEMQLVAENHTIVFHTQGECVNAYMDEKLLRHIFSNLLSNAIKYSPSGGTVKFEFVAEQTAIFRIQDQGIGIPQADIPQLFNSFHRASNVGTISGTGLGLAIVKKSVALHKGEIFVKSVVGTGTEFIVKLPLNLGAGG